MIYRLSRTDMQLRLCNRSQYPTNVRLLSLEEFYDIAECKIEGGVAKENWIKIIFFQEPLLNTKLV